MALPILTPEQRQAALEKAAQARQLRAEVKNRLKNSGATQSMPGVGKVRAKEIMDRIGIADSRRLRGLGANQIQALLKEFGGGRGGKTGA